MTFKIGDKVKMTLAYRKELCNYYQKNRDPWNSSYLKTFAKQEAKVVRVGNYDYGLNKGAIIDIVWDNEIIPGEQRSHYSFDFKLA